MGNISRAAKTKQLKSGTAGPVDKGIMITACPQMVIADDSFGQIIDLLKTITPGYGQAAAAPQIFKRRLAVVSLPHFLRAVPGLSFQIP